MQGLALDEGLAQKVALADAHTVLLKDALVETEGEGDMLVLRLLEGDGDADAEGLPLPLAQGDTDALIETVSLDDPVALRLPEGEELGEGLRVSQPEAVTETHAEAEGECVCVTLVLWEDEADVEVDALLLPLLHAEPDALPDGEGVLQWLELSDALMEGE